MKKIMPASHACTHPNAADRRYRIDKAIDTALTAAATVGLVLSLLFLMFILPI